jgi:hypothetical protein
MNELDVQNIIRIEAAKIGMILWRNNSGALRDIKGRLVRYGLGNDSTTTNKVMKSSDLIGIYKGLFVAIECKAEGWTYRGTDRELAQSAFLMLVRRNGGIGCFASKWADVLEVING